MSGAGPARFLSRPVVHAGMLGFAWLTPFFGRWGMVGVALAALLLNAFVLPRTAHGRALARPGEPRWNGLLSYPLGVALLYALFPPEAAVAAWAVLALGDPMAAWAGRHNPGGPRIPWNRGKSIAGTITFFTVGWAGAVLLAATAVPAVAGLPRERIGADGLTIAVFLGWTAAGALAGAVAETLDLGIDDNLPVALAAGGALALLSP